MRGSGIISCIGRAALKAACILVYFTGIYAICDRIFRANGVYILFYHHLEKDTRYFEKQIRYFKTAYRLISMDEAAKLLKSGGRLSERYMAVTFDDGYRDNFLYGAKVFEKYGLKPTIYIAVGPVENREVPWHDQVARMVSGSGRRRAKIRFRDVEFSARMATASQKDRLAYRLKEMIKHHDEDFRKAFLQYLGETLGTMPGTPEAGTEGQGGLMMDWDEIRELRRIGANIGGHTMNHATLHHLPPEVLNLEMLQSKLLAEKRLGCRVVHFAYPNGLKSLYGPDAVAEAEKYYDTAVTTIPGVNAPGDDLFQMKRIGIACDTRLVFVKVKMLRLAVRHLLSHKSL